MKREHFSADFAVRVALHADVHGSDAAAKHFEISLKTVGNYRRFCRGERAECAELYQQKTKLIRARLDDEFIRYLSRWAHRLDTLVMGSENIREVAGAVKIVGDLSTVREAAFRTGDQPPEQPQGQHPGDEGSGPFGAPEPFH